MRGISGLAITLAWYHQECVLSQVGTQSWYDLGQRRDGKPKINQAKQACCLMQVDHDTVVACTDLSGKQPRRQVRIDRVVASESIVSVMVRTRAPQWQYRGIESCSKCNVPDQAESVEHWSRVWKIVGSNPSRVKPMTYKIDTCCMLARYSALLG